jgi:hypothetical protein
METLPGRMALPLALAAACLAGGCDIKVDDSGVSLDIAHGRATDEWIRTYTLPANGHLHIININGPIEAERAVGGQIQVRIERIARAGADVEAAALLKSVRMDEQITRDRVRIAAVSTEQAGTLRSFARNAVTLRYHLGIPDGLNVTLEAGNGSIRLKDINGYVVASMTNGAITAEGLSGGLKATADNGGIRVAMASLTHNLEVSTTNGGIRLEVPEDIQATLNARCVNGAISVDERLPIEATERSRRQVTGTINGGGPKIIASTVNGRIRINAPGARRSD